MWHTDCLLEAAGRLAFAAYLLTVTWLALLALDAVDQGGPLVVEAVQFRGILVDERVVLCDSVSQSAYRIGQDALPVQARCCWLSTLSGNAAGPQRGRAAQRARY